ncbi:MAG: hypothetical protein DUD32_12625 [Lactobacillus sp.]|nr:MAG: hypothetical protein DUD32_12625 [Lactobacillus sp.]
MTELKDNSIEVRAVLTDVHPTKQGVTKVNFEVDTELLDGRFDELTRSLDSIIGIKITPNQTELDVDSVNKEADGQADLLKDGD